jgi:hypothetical protein
MKREETKKKELKIIMAHQEVLQSCGEFAPHLGQSFIINKSIKLLGNRGVKVSRTSFYKALKQRKNIKKEEGFLRDEN